MSVSANVILADAGALDEIVRGYPFSPGESTMHLTSSAQVGVRPRAPKLDFAWLELTNRCNLQCVHCYAESAPTSGDKDLLTESDYLSLIRQIRNLGCETIQFIGGEPTLNRSLPVLLQAARDEQFTFIEVFTNLTRLPERLLADLCRLRIAVATSFYSSDPDVHDGITSQSGSFQRTVQNIRRVLKAGLELRVGIIEMEENRAGIAKTWDFLRQIGVPNVGTDRLRKIGRASPDSACDMRELCGSCAGNVVSIGPRRCCRPLQHVQKVVGWLGAR
jgi:MoaA/NifB/PqqE/SkfB family radical SAM enzyme